MVGQKFQSYGTLKSWYVKRISENRPFPASARAFATVPVEYRGIRSDSYLHISRFGAGAVLAVSTKIKILGSCIDESPKGFGSI